MSPMLGLGVRRPVKSDGAPALSALGERSEQLEDYESPEPALWSSELTDRSPVEESSPEAVARIVEYADAW